MFGEVSAWAADLTVEKCWIFEASHGGPHSYLSIWEVVAVGAGDQGQLQIPL